MVSAIAEDPMNADLPSGRYVETLYESGLWQTRWQRGVGGSEGTDEPFALGQSRERMIAAGAEVARWNQVPHLIRNPDGSVAELDSYGSGPYPYRSPSRRRPTSGR
jgi:hypothetical protein